MKKELDSIHCDFSKIDGLERPLNCVFANRHDGKTTNFLMKKTWRRFRGQGSATTLLFRQVNDCNEGSMRYYETLMDPFLDEPLDLAIKPLGPCLVGLSKKKPIFYGVPLGMKEASLKKTAFANSPLMLFDEMEINPANGERYLQNEAGRFKSLFGTMRKVNPDLRFYALSNPYSAYNPILMDWGVDTRKLRLGTLQKGKNWAVWFKEMDPRLIERIRKEDPLFDERSEYGRWAYGGEFANDANNHVAPMGAGYRLSQVFVFEGQRFGAYELADPFVDEGEPYFYFKKERDLSKRRTAFAFDFGDLIRGSVLFTRSDRDAMARIKRSIRAQDFACDSIETENAFKTIYDCL